MVYEMEIQTYHGLKKLEGINGQPYLELVYAVIMRSVNEYEKGKKDVLEIIVKLPLDE
jgi:hypothetical protein